VDGHTVKEMADEITLSMDIEFKCLNGWLQHFEVQWHITKQATSMECAIA
jgi:hypothetical protein